MVAYFFVCTSVIRSSNEQLEQRSSIYESQGLFAHPGFCKLSASYSRNMCTAACHVAGGRG